MLDWDDLRFFLAVARTGSLSAAARELRCTQTTVGRRLASLEARLAVRLLNRTPRGYVATLAGESIREHVERIDAEAASVERIVAGRDARLEGKVTVTCIESIANLILAPCFARLHQNYPGVVIELLPPDRHVSLPAARPTFQFITSAPSSGRSLFGRLAASRSGFTPAPITSDGSARRISLMAALATESLRCPTSSRICRKCNGLLASPQTP